MEIQIRNRPSFANLLVRLARGESIVAESDAMASMSSSITLQTRWNGGFWRAVLRRLCDHIRPGGYLFLGHSETILGFDLPVVTVANTVFRRV